jgi:hypothetical protein
MIVIIGLYGAAIDIKAGGDPQPCVQKASRHATAATK